MIKKKGEIKQRLIDAAIKVIGENGFRKTTVPMITKRAGVGTGTFYLYFKDKSHIFTEAIIYVSTSLRNYIDEVFHKRLKLLKGKRVRVDDIKVSLNAIYNAFFEYIDNYRNNFIVLFHEGLSHNENFASAMGQTYQNLAADTRLRLLTASQFGLIRSLSRVEAETIAWAMVGMLSQVAQLYIADSHDREKLINILVDFTINGIRKDD